MEWFDEPIKVWNGKDYLKHSERDLLNTTGEKDLRVVEKGRQVGIVWKNCGLMGRKSSQEKLWFYQVDPTFDQTLERIEKVGDISKIYWREGGWNKENIALDKRSTKWEIQNVCWKA